jgi:hypothetical protein
MKKLIAPAVVLVTLVVVTLVVLRTGGERPPLVAHPDVDALVGHCDPQGSSLSTMYDRVVDKMPAFIAEDRAKALAAARGQVANVIDGRLSVCEQALAIAQHERRGSAAAAASAAVEKLDVAHAALLELEAALGSAGGDPAAKLAALTDAVHATSH